MGITKKNRLTALLSSSLLVTSLSISAAEQPLGADLVGQYFGGIHLMNIQTDNERTLTEDPRSYMDQGNGVGGEIGYRWLPSTELRLSYGQFDLDSAHKGFNEPDGATLAMDVLFFPTEKNFYVIGGVNNLDIGQSQISGNLGAGYRHYFSQNNAFYIESKANYQFSERYDELTTQVGFIHFFGSNEQTARVKQNKKVVAASDSDKDGVVDNRDRCPGTPMVDKVDAAGCTIFVDDKTSIELLVKFDHDKDIIKPEFYAEVAAMADFLNANKNIALVIEGHTSSLGSAEYNKALSLKRANAIVKRLISTHSVKAGQLSVLGYGEEQLINPENTQAAHAQNRRVMANISVSKRVPVKR
ncbi:OmpA family protein [Thalassotalea atypica]|uniref:OmpA family protein n=1 Tax=Thalassotalea atypica TaxID=2054316 RepID=UPI002573BB05|nr:OmpA family protein [Thalassotalea atypica]